MKIKFHIGERFLKNTSILFLVVFFVFACTPDKDDSIYDYPDNTVVKNDEDSSVKNDNTVINDSDSQLPDTHVLPDGEQPDTLTPDNESTDDPFIATCGNGIVDFGEVCERDTEKECSAIDPGSYVDGVAKCNDSCSGWIVSDCVSVGCETAVDNPDDAFADTNCDGIDGDASASVFVDKLNGLNTNPGTKDLPVATIMKALEIAQEQDKKHILVGTGAYSEQVELKEGISIHGGYSGHPNWARGVEYEVQIVSGNPCVIADAVSDVTLAFLVIRAANNFEETGNSTAVLLKNSSMIYLNNVNIESGHGSSTGSSGSAGAGGTGTGGSGGTSPYSSDRCPEPSIKGNDGNSGNIGEHGAAGKSFGGYDENGYLPGHGGDGATGTHGHGGGGGGPSIGIVSIESTFDGIMHTTFLVGKGGEGGKSEFNEGYPGKENMVLEY